jgi:hypothetical protein
MKMEQVIEYKEKRPITKGLVFTAVVLLIVGGIIGLSVFTGKVHNVLLFQISGFLYAVSAVLYIVGVFLKGEKMQKLATISAFSAWIIQTGGLFVRGIEAYNLGIFHPPWTNLYESLMFFSWLATTLYLYIEREYKIKAIGVPI